MSSLDLFFDELVPYVMGGRTSAELEARLGSSPSGRRRLEVYAGVVPKNLAIALEAMYSAVKRAADAVATGLWKSLVAEFLTAHPPRHADPNKCGEPFADFLVKRRASGAHQPAFLEELADYEGIRFRASTAPTAGPDRTVFVRRYSHAVPAYAAASSDASKEPGWQAVPEAMPVTAVVFRSTRTLKVRVFTPSNAQLFALARCQGELDEELLSKSGLSLADLGRATDLLRDMGVLEQEAQR